MLARECVRQRIPSCRASEKGLGLGRPEALLGRALTRMPPVIYLGVFDTVFLAKILRNACVRQRIPPCRASQKGLGLGRLEALLGRALTCMPPVIYLWVFDTVFLAKILRNACKRERSPKNLAV